jgi:hypothetical protein
MLAAALQAHGFEVRSITPDTYPLSVVASAVVQASLLIGINSGAYNAVFLPTGCGVLELAPHVVETYFKGAQPVQVGFESLGVHQYCYACPHLYTRDFLQRISDSALGTHSPIVVSPRTILRLLHELRGILLQARESGSEVGSITIAGCLPWETNHSRNWTPWRSPHDDDASAGLD